MLLTFILVQTPWIAWKKTHTIKGDISPAAASFALGIYPDLIYKDPSLRGQPYKEDPAYDKMSRSAVAAIEVLLQRASKDPWTYIKWYVFEKPLMFWSWDTLFGQRGPYVYPLFYCIYNNYWIFFAT